MSNFKHNAESAIIADMIIRQRNLQKRTNVIAKMQHDYYRFKRQLIVYLTLMSAAVLLAVYYYYVDLKMVSLVMQVQIGILLFGLLVVVTGYGAYRVVNHGLFKRLLLVKKQRLRTQNAGALLAAKRWLQFYYHDRDIAPLIGEILFYLELHDWQPTIEAAITAIDHQKTAVNWQQDRQKLAYAIAQTNQMILSTVNPQGGPASRQMRFITLPGAPEVWYFGTAPQTPKINDLALGQAAVHTLPTVHGMTIASNRLTVKRSAYQLAELAEYYRQQVPGFMDGLTPEDQAKELIYEVHLQSARLDTWAQHEQLSFNVK